MKSNRMMWILVVLVVSATMAITFGTFDSSGQENCKSQTATTPTSASPFGDLSKYPTVDYDAPEVATAPEHEKRVIKNNRYDVVIPVLKYAPPEITEVGGSDVESVPPAIPSTESRLIVIGEILDSKALLSNEKKGIYSEYSLKIHTILKNDKDKKLQKNEIITIDRVGGVVRYPSGQKILYLLDWHNLPELGGRYIFFLDNDDDQNPNYQILTGYKLEGGKVKALDNHPNFTEFNGKNETDFIKLVLSKNN